jgi:hypothetical protein
VELQIFHLRCSNVIPRYEMHDILLSYFCQISDPQPVMVRILEQFLMKKLLKLDMKHQLAYNESDATIVKPLIFLLIY